MAVAMAYPPPAARRERGQAAVFLDKDGTLVQDLPYNVQPHLIRLAPGALRGACALAAAGYRLVVVSNQPGVALGLHAETALEGVRAWLSETFGAHGVSFTGIYWCPHHPRGLVREYAHACDCRKPQPGLLLRAACQHGIALERSWFIGDILDDVEAGRRAGCRTILLDNGNETQWVRSPLRTPHHLVGDLGAAADLILANAALAAGRAS